MPRAHRFTVVLALCLGAMMAAPAHGEDRDRHARTLFAAGRYQEALDLYAQLYADTLHPTYVRNVGRCYQAMGQPDPAIASFREYLRKAKPLTPEQRAEVEGFIQEMEELKRSRAAGAAPNSARPGPRWAAPAPPSAPAGTPSLGVAEQGEAAPSHGHALWWVAGGAVVAAAVVAVVLATRSSAQPFCPECGLSTASVPTR